MTTAVKGPPGRSAAAAGLGAQRKASDPPRATIALLDDDEDWREAAARTLRHEGYAVVEMEDLATLESTLRQHPVDVVVADSRLPDGDGWREAVRLAGLTGRARVVVVSGYDEDSILLSGGSVLGPYVQKAGGAGALLEAIEAVLRA